MENKFRNTRVEFHILQSFPVSCLNRDDVGAPKSALIGGSERARVSSQCWKRAVRLAMHDMGVKTACRTRFITDMIKKECIGLGAAEDVAAECALAAAKAFAKSVKEDGTSKNLFFISASEAKKIAETFRDKEFKSDIKDNDKKKDKKIESDIQKICKNALNPAVDGLDIALFGRMVAQAADMNMEASASFAHAISTHKVASEVDFFTAVDDCKTEEDFGSAHMGSLEFNSATYYRYVSLDLGQLAENMKTEDIADAIAAFTKALFVAVPQARQATMSASCPWEYAVVTVRNGQRIQLPFENAVKLSREYPDYLSSSKKVMLEQLDSIEKMYGSLYGLKKKVEIGLGLDCSIDKLVEELQRSIG